MENKIHYKKYIKLLIVFSIVFFAVILFFVTLEHNRYKKAFNEKTSAIIEETQKKYPDMTSEDILNILEKSKGKSNPLKKFGYDIKKDDFLSYSEKNTKLFLVLISLTTVTFIGLIIYLFDRYSTKNANEIDDIIKTLERINQRKYDLELETLSEDKFSILKNEIYKTTVMLKEVAQNEKNAKNNLKDSLSDISHQLKTPLTSILIMLDDIIDDKDMRASTRESFLKSIRREIMNLNFLVQTILKLSKFDADAIEFKRREVYPLDIVESAIENTSPLADLKNVKIVKKVVQNKKIVCDERWQTEALTNVIKNAIEHSKEKNTVKIEVEANDIFTSILIKDEGVGMSKKDLRHIFDRFYKGENSSKDSIGIGLSLAKVIIERDNGKISVASKIGVGTTFTIKYFHN